MIFNELRGHLQSRKDIRYALIIDNKLVTFDDKTNDVVYVAYTSEGIQFGRKGNNTNIIEPVQEIREQISEMLSCRCIDVLDFGDNIDVNKYTVHVNTEIKTIIITTAALNRVVSVLRRFDGKFGVQINTKGFEIKHYTEEEFARIFKNIVSTLYERFREGAMNYLIRKILYIPELKNRAAVNLVKIKHVFVTVFFHIDGIYQPSDFSYIQNMLKDTTIYKMTEAYGVTFEVSDASITLLTHKEVCQSFHLTNYLAFNTMLIQDMIYSELLDGTPSYFDRYSGGVYLLFGKPRSPETKLIVYEPDDNYIEVSPFAIRIATNKHCRNNAYNVFRYISGYSL